jgi:hypothetical protein
MYSISVLLTNLKNALVIENFPSNWYHIFLTIRQASYIGLVSLRNRELAYICKGRKMCKESNVSQGFLEKSIVKSLDFYIFYGHIQMQFELNRLSSNAS